MDVDHRQNLRELSFTGCHVEHSGKHTNTHINGDKSWVNIELIGCIDYKRSF